MNHDEAHLRAHEKAIADMTAESYLLGDLSDSDADAFEKHYFDCSVCSDTIRAGAAMFAAGREVVIERDIAGPLPVPEPLPAPLPFRQRAKQWMSVAAAAMLSFVIGAGFFRPPAPPPIPLLASMEVADPHGSIAGVMRGPEDVELIHFEGNRAAEIIIFTPSQLRYPAYRLELRDGSEKVLHRLDLSPKQALHDDGVPVLLRALPAGRYVLVILGVRKEGNHPELARKSVVVQ
jgi:hypothetical protein